MTLDATCGDREWPEKADIRIDIDPRKKPDMVMDCTDLKFKDGEFGMIYFHPPYIINGGLLQRIVGRFAFFLHWEDWWNFLIRSEAEFYRCLSPGGFLVCNVDEGHWYGMCHFEDIVSLYKGRWTMASDDKTPVAAPLGNRFRHVITFKKV